MKIAVIGAGAAGMFFSIVAARAEHSVTVFEKNEKCGKKLYITGKGRCNLTNDCDRETFLKNVVSNLKFMYAAISGFAPVDTIRFFEDLGLKLKTERGQRVFPVSDKSSDVIFALTEGMKSAGVTLKRNAAVEKILATNGVVFGVTVGGKEMRFDKVVVATGGISYPATGSTGDGYRFASNFEMTVIDPKPSLVELKTEFTKSASGEMLKREGIPSLQGLSLKNVTLKAERNGKTIREEFGEMLFTAEGVSGPIALTLSSYLAKTDWNEVTLKLDLKPALTKEQLDLRLQREIAANPKKRFKNWIAELLPAKAIPFFIELSDISEDREACSFTRTERETIGSLLKSIAFTGISAAGFRSAVVTSGGVSVKEVDPKTMESKKVKGLYFIGEVLDVDALTGGFNLQIAFSTAYAAANHLTED